MADSEEWCRAFDHFISVDDPWNTRLLVLRPWRTIVIGRYKTHEAYLKAFKKVGRHVELRYTLPMFFATPLLQNEQEVVLFRLTTKDLALGGSTFYPRVTERMPT